MEGGSKNVDSFTSIQWPLIRVLQVALKILIDTYTLGMDKPAWYYPPSPALVISYSCPLHPPPWGIAAWRVLSVPKQTSATTAMTTSTMAKITMHTMPLLLPLLLLTPPDTTKDEENLSIYALPLSKNASCPYNIDPDHGLDRVRVPFQVVLVVLRQQRASHCFISGSSSYRWYMLSDNYGSIFGGFGRSGGPS